MNSRYLFGLSIISGLMLWASWPVSPLTFLIFFAFVPLLILEEKVSKPTRLLGFLYIAFLIWNGLTTWWIWNAAPAGSVAAILLNSLLMSVPWLLFSMTRKKFGNFTGWTSLVFYVLSFEFIHHSWELSWPWLTLGNVFSTRTEWVQWYEYTGTSGGTFWVLVSNILFYKTLKELGKDNKKKVYRTGLKFAAALLLPILFSVYILNYGTGNYEGNANRNVVIVQPNIDPYLEKFEAGTEMAQIQKLISLSKSQIDSNTTLVVWPETAISAEVWETEIKENYFMASVWQFLEEHPNIHLITGLNSYLNYGNNKDASPSARKFSNADLYYDAFNTAAMLDSSKNIQLYHKSKLVPGVEIMPYEKYLQFLNNWVIDLGGISGTLGTQKERTVFFSKDSTIKAAPIICYESIYSDYITRYVRNGANILTIITNDGWWGNTPGYQQHIKFARLRAIENRRWIVRSANTGISCFIDPIGNVYQQQPWDKEASIKMDVSLLNEMTFYSRYGDMISRAANIFSILFLLLLFMGWIKSRFTSRKK